MITTTTAASIREGDFIHRVRPLPLSAVFERPIDARVASVTDLVFHGVPFARIALEGPYATVLNLALDREVTVDTSRLVSA